MASEQREWRVLIADPTVILDGDDNFLGFIAPAEYAALAVRAVNRDHAFEQVVEILYDIAGFAPGHGDVCEIIAKRVRKAIALAEGAGE